MVKIIRSNFIGRNIFQIFNGAFSPEGVAGGAIGVLVQGFRRAAFSNEAGVGTEAMAHGAAKTREPVREGLVAMLNPTPMRYLGAASGIRVAR